MMAFNLKQKIYTKFTTQHKIHRYVRYATIVNVALFVKISCDKFEMRLWLPNFCNRLILSLQTTRAAAILSCRKV